MNYNSIINKTHETFDFRNNISSLTNESYQKGFNMGELDLIQNINCLDYIFIIKLLIKIKFKCQNLYLSC